MTEAVRADARRNYELLLSVAREAFAEHGTDASLRDVARRAGVGIGTLYRHFPTREALLEALFRTRFDDLRLRAEDLLSSQSPREALVAWLKELAIGSTTYRGLPESVMAAVRDPDSELHASCMRMRGAGAALLDRAQRSGDVRSDVTIEELMALAAGVAWVSSESTGGADLVDRLMILVTTGLATA
ncbi:TetR/AcrR family transcriptional regulator [Sphaerisporangium fuscum]|uniref:TetR/AcrR family transcriptional regulator n=1 Tax=Sphaerisporangium fuscum TaxID=2835868 RepID=UPI001BDD96E1|nr:TetR/AcrR family transcriptional regulator [Sphaerisporangium fuscum]